MQLKDIMTKDISTVNADSSIQETARTMRDLNVGSIPVCRGREPVGMVTDRDITIRSVSEGNNLKTPVEKIMTGNLIYGTPDMSADEAARLMAQKQIRRLPIVEKGRLVGIVSLGDLAVEDKTDMEAARALSSISIPSKPNK